MILLLDSSLANSETQSNEFEQAIAKGYIEFFCQDEDFISCSGVNQGVCISGVEEAVASCDISKLEANIDKAVQSQTEVAQEPKHAQCLTEAFPQYLEIESSLFEACLSARFQKKLESVRQKRGNESSTE